MNRQMRIVAVVLIATVVTAGAVALGAVTNGTYTTTVTLPPPPTDMVGLTVRAQAINPQASTMTMTLIPRVGGSFGRDLPNGAFFTTPVLFNADVSSGQATVKVPASSIRGGLSAQVPLSGSQASYPFDTYTASLFASAATQNDAATDDAGFVLSDANTVVPGFDVTATPRGFLDAQSTTTSLAADQQAGYGYVEWSIVRSSTTKFVVLVLGLLIVLGTVVSLLITWAIVTHRRPPSINAMVWLAAFLFALFQVRRLLPGDPGSGIAFDRFLFYPVILVLVLLIVVNLLAWSTREDWDLANPMTPEQGSGPGSTAQESNAFSREDQ